MSPLLLTFVGISLLTASVFGVIAFVQAGTTQKLRTRVQTAGGVAIAGTAADAAAALPSIRVESKNERAWLGSLQRFVRFYPDVRVAYTTPPVAVAVVGFLVGAFAASRLHILAGVWPALLAGTVIGIMLVRTVFAMQFNAYRDKVFQQIPDALGQMVRTVRAGLPMAEALRSVSREMPAPTSTEFARVVGDIAIGRPLDQSLLRLSERCQLTEYAFLAVTLGVQAQTGGSLAETLDNLADTVRKRVGIAKRAGALAAEAKMQAGILAVLPFIAATAMSAIQPFYIETFTEHPTGRKLAVIGFCFLVLGLLSIRWLIKKAGKD